MIRNILIFLIYHVGDNIQHNARYMCTCKVCRVTTTEQAFSHLPNLNNNLGPNSVRDKNIFSRGW